jgi:alanine racemase
MAKKVRGSIHDTGRPVWAEISLRALAHNFHLIRKHIGRKRKILAVVKADAYGHGGPAVARALARAGADWFGVTCSAEGMELREAGIRQPILLMTGFWPGEERAILRHRLTPTVHHLEQLRPLERAAAHSRANGRRRLDFHLKIDTGMNRLGIPPGQIAEFMRALAACPHLSLGGTYSHFASAEDFTCTQTEDQEKIFADALAQLRAAGIAPGLVHLANSAGVVSRPSSWWDMVRPGAVLYGYHQNYAPPERRAEAERVMPLEPALSLRARIISIREAPVGASIGYGAQFVTSRASSIAVLSAGYADGLVRKLSGRGRVLVRGQEAPLAGVISMDLAMADVTGIPAVQVGDVATIYGADGAARLSPSLVARELGTVTSDLLCALGKRVPRYYLD